MEEDFITEIFEPVEMVVEMATNPSGLVPLPLEFLQEVTQGDDKPVFGTYVIESGWSKSKRFWGPELFGGVASEINSAATTEPIVGYRGHIRPDDDPYDFPEIQLQWVGAKLQQMGEKAKLAVKAYFLPGTKARDYAGRRLAQTVSWRGKVAQEMFQKGVRIKEFQIESIDLARPRAAGMSARLVALTSEMDTEGRKEVKPEEILALQPNELRAHNPGLVKTIEDEVRAPLDTKIGEMTTEATAVQPTLDLIPDLRKALKLNDDTDTVDVIKAAVSHLRQAGTDLRDAVLAKVLDKKLKGEDEKSRNLVRRIIMSEMKTREVTLSGDEAKDEAAVSEMVNEIISSSDDLKQIVSEMEDTPASLPSSSTERSGQARTLKAGDKTSNLRVRSAV
jgi:hypothetical protein